MGYAWGVPSTAYLDEAQVGGTGSGRAFILSATVWLCTDLDDRRAALRSMKPRGQDKLHWNEAVAVVQDAVVAHIAQLEVVHLVAVRRDTRAERPERSRRIAIARLVHELQNYFEVERMVFESRGRADNQRDLDLLGKLRAQKYLLGPLRFDHVAGPKEPLLWVPDALAGVIVDYEAGHSRHLSSIAHQLTMIDC